MYRLLTTSTSAETADREGHPERPRVYGASLTIPPSPSLHLIPLSPPSDQIAVAFAFTGLDEAPFLDLPLAVDEDREGNARSMRSCNADAQVTEAASAVPILKPEAEAAA